ncbi:hypothetical protein CR983_02965 [Candidatus Saccharibacteria bacterium]|nr:MAG: hypothetical protein CR983_02965 [Candidatus Saccharibacteria bacterium]
MPITITALRFIDGRSYPSRIEIGGRIIYLDQPASENYISFCRGSKHFWLQRHGHSWRWFAQ